MRTIKLLSLVVTCMCGATRCLAAPVADNPITVRVASYNVEFGKRPLPVTNHIEQKLQTERTKKANNALISDPAKRIRENADVKKKK